MYNRILVPTDGSATADAAMEHAIDLAEKYNADIHILHVINSWQYDTSIESAVEPLRKESNEYVKRLSEAAMDVDIPVTSAIEIGKPAHHMLEYVNEHDIELIVMGTRGQGGLPRRLLGSVTDYIVTHADVPVHVVPTAHEDEQRNADTR